MTKVLTGGAVLNAAIGHLTETWGQANCTGFVYTVAFEGGNIFFDPTPASATEIGPLGASGASLLNNFFKNDPHEHLFGVPITDGGVAIADPTFDNWSPVGFGGGNVTDPGFRDFQPGDLFRGNVTGNNGNTVMHAGVVAAYDAATNTLWLVDNGIHTKGAVGTPIGYTDYLVDPNVSPRHVGSLFSVYRLDSAVINSNDIIRGTTKVSNVIGGGWGNDAIYGSRLSDTLFGGDDNDKLYSGGQGNRVWPMCWLTD